MNKTILEVPVGVRYISQWNGFRLNDFPHILDKKIPGCGFTEWCITNNEDTILCSPRKILLQNKYDQHKKDVFLVVNEYEKVIDSGKDLVSRKPSLPKKDQIELTKEQKEEFFKKLTENLKYYIEGRAKQGKPAKILVTYDSFSLVYDILHFAMIETRFQVIVDEFQSIFTDSRFKSTTEMKFMSYLKKLKRVCFVSATPMIDTYLDRLDDFKFLPYYELDWESLSPGRVKKPDLKVRISKAIFTSAKKIIESYKSGKFEYKFLSDQQGNPVKIESREAVIYVNSVNNILSIIKKSGLKPGEVNILCANTEENKKKIRRKLGKGFDIGSVPLRDQIHKMFTFCTRTVYLGADFYSTCARTFVISDANIETLAVDISLDLPQILGRQRLEENPWKNSAEFYYKPLALGNRTSREVFDERVAEKVRMTESLIKSYYDVSTSDQKKDLAKTYQNVAEVFNYKDQYVAVDRFKTGNIIRGKDGSYKEEYIFKPVKNNLVLIAEERAYDIQQIDYADRFTVFNSLDSKIGLGNLDVEVQKFMQVYESLPRLYDKLKYLCEYECDGRIKSSILEHITEKHFKEYYLTLGPEKLKTLGYGITQINKYLGIITFDATELNKEILSSFNVGDKLTVSEVKEKLANIYIKTGYEKTPTSKDLEEWFELKKIVINTKIESGKYKRDRGFEILAKK